VSGVNYFFFLTTIVSDARRSDCHRSLLESDVAVDAAGDIFIAILETSESAWRRRTVRFPLSPAMVLKGIQVTGDWATSAALDSPRKITQHAIRYLL
jgi:hypothetical protein